MSDDDVKEHTPVPWGLIKAPDGFPNERTSKPLPSFIGLLIIVVAGLLVWALIALHLV